MTEPGREPEIFYPPIGAAEVQRMRRVSGLSQAGFANALGAHNLAEGDSQYTPRIFVRSQARSGRGAPNG